MGSRRGLIAAILAGACVASPAALRKDTWLRARTTHLTIISSAAEKATRDAADRLERFIDAFASLAKVDVQPDVPVTVMVFRDRATYAPFRPVQNGRTLNLAGYFRRGDDQNLIALSLERTEDDRPDRVIFHEYAHALTSRAAAVWPLWLQEGLAEFTSTFEADDRHVEVGHPIDAQLRLLRREPWLPLATLIAVDPSSPLYNEAQQNIYYAQSWALVHYLMLGDRGRHRAAFDGFLERLAAGDASGRALTAATGMNEQALDNSLRVYITSGSYRGDPLTIDRRAPRAAPILEPLTEAEANVYQGNLLLRVGRRDAAEPFFKRAKAADPKTQRLEESLGFLALLQGKYADALAHLTLAIAQEPENHLAHYYYAEALRRPVMDQGKPLPPDIARQMVAPLRKAIALAPTFTRGYYLLGSAMYVAQMDLDEAARLLREAVRLAPPHRNAMLMLASVQLLQRDFSAARATAQAIIDAPDATERLKSEARIVRDRASALGGR